MLIIKKKHHICPNISSSLFFFSFLFFLFLEGDCNVYDIFFSLPFDPYLNTYLLPNIHLTNIMIHLNIQVDGPKGSKISLKGKKKKTEQQASNQIARNYPVKPDNKGVVPLNWTTNK